MTNKCVVFLVLTLCNLTLHAQDTKKLAEAQKLFNIRNYEKALPLYLEAFQSGVNDPLAFYQAGSCYLKTNADSILENARC